MHIDDISIQLFCQFGVNLYFSIVTYDYVFVPYACKIRFHAYIITPGTYLFTNSVNLYFSRLTNYYLPRMRM